MPKIIEYTIILNPADLVRRQVQEYLKEGWQPLGCAMPHSSLVFQTMVKYQEEK